jgi:diguanylate cyclase (GGDEF)-like protein
METKVDKKGFSVYLAAAAGTIGIVAGVAGSFLGLVPALAVAALGAASLGFFGAALMATGKKRKPAASTAGTAAVPESQIPLDRIDSLTGLANANGLAAWFSEKAQRLSDDGKMIFILLADLDKADEIERLRGKETAEAVIKEVAKRVSGFTGPEGIAARTGNDEFVAVAAVLPANAMGIAEDSAGKLAEIICRPVDLGGSTIWIGGAVGAATGSPQDSDGVLIRAKSALQKARKLGLGRFWVDGAS